MESGEIPQIRDQSEIGKDPQISVLIEAFHSRLCPGVLFNQVACFLGVTVDRLNGEVGSVVGVERQAFVPLGILLWQHERLGDLARLVD